MKRKAKQLLSHPYAHSLFPSKRLLFLKIKYFSPLRTAVTVNEGELKGTPVYMAPEYMSSAPHGRKIDVWSLGCVVVHMATGQLPYQDRLLVNEMFRLRVILMVGKGEIAR